MYASVREITPASAFPTSLIPWCHHFNTATSQSIKTAFYHVSLPLGTSLSAICICVASWVLLYGVNAGIGLTRCQPWRERAISHAPALPVQQVFPERFCIYFCDLTFWDHSKLPEYDDFAMLFQLYFQRAAFQPATPRNSRPASPPPVSFRLPGQRRLQLGLWQASLYCNIIQLLSWSLSVVVPASKPALLFPFRSESWISGHN